jgi:hypothetical protein
VVAGTEGSCHLRKSPAGACLSGKFRRVTYGAGLKGGEVAMLRVGALDSKRMLIRRAGGTEPP